jgi:5-methyltetrahydropteroyltriglutamate--homocysteine methyltransferase
MAGVEFLANLPADKGLQVGVLDIRSMMIESPEAVAARARQVLEHVPAERVTLSTDCGMKALPRTVAKLKLKALVDGAAIARSEL